MRRHLYLRFYFAFVAIAVVCVLVVAGASKWVFDHERTVPGQVARCLRAVGSRLPPTDAPHLDRALHRRAKELESEVSLFSSDGALLSQTGTDLPPPDSMGPPLQWFHAQGRGGLHVKLEDGRWFAVVGPPRRGPRPYTFFPTMLVLILVVVGVGALPVARRVTRRLESLKRGVESWGEGHLSARVPVEGADEVAQLAERFNWAAERIERLVTRQRRVLAHASHELRSPLTRMRMALELLDDGTPEKRRLIESAGRDAEELDALIGDVLLAARLDAIGEEASAERVPVDLAALARDEAERHDAAFATHDLPDSGAFVSGDITMLRRLIRNLVDNAAKYGQGGPIELTVRGAGSQLIVEVADRGPGLPAGEEHRVFEPFYRPAGHAEGAHGGVGLGLSLVQQVAEHHGGTVVYSPRQGGGSVFTVTIPAAPPAAASAGA